jgi:hypothetical protein
MEKLRRKAIRLGATDFRKSTRAGKKYSVEYMGKIIHFGARGMSDYTQHGDNKRRARYLKRATAIRDGQGKLTHRNKTKSNFWAINILW